MRYYLVFGQLQRALGVSWEEIGNSWWIAISRASDLRDDSESRECVVCMEEDIPLADLCVLPCAHAMCMTCAKDVIKQTGLCPTSLHRERRRCSLHFGS